VVQESVFIQSMVMVHHVKDTCHSYLITYIIASTKIKENQLSNDLIWSNSCWFFTTMSQCWQLFLSLSMVCIMKHWFYQLPEDKKI